MNRAHYQSVDEYIGTFPESTQATLQQLRETIRKAAPKATEKISYQIPTFALQRNLVHFAAYKHHIGFYPGAAAIVEFKKELSPYKGAKGSVQFPIDEPLPLPLISRIVKFRVKAELARQKK